MDLVKSVTQNSNNRNVTMENDNSNGKNDEGARSEPAGSPATPKRAASAAGQPVAAVKAAPSAQVPDYLRAIGMDPRKFWPKKYRFTREKSPGVHNPLTIAQRNFYENNGYLVIDQCVSNKLLEAIRAQYKTTNQLIDEFLVDKLVAKNAKLLQYVKCFCDERVMLMTHTLIEHFQDQQQAKDMMDNRETQRQRLFRDWLYLPFRPIDKVVCCITALEPIEHVILVVPGTHKIGQCSISSTLESITAAYETSQERGQSLAEIELYESAPENLSSLVEKSKKGFKYVNLKPGQTLFHHPGLINGYTDDLINFGRRQLASIAYYASADCEYVDLRQSLDSATLAKGPIPLSLAHFSRENKHPGDYNSWLDKPKLLNDSRGSNL